MIEDDHGLAGLRGRRVIAIFLVGIVAVAVPTVLLSTHNPWHYVYLIPFGRTPRVLTVLVLSPAILGTAAWLLMGKRRRVWAVAGVVAALTVIMCAAGYQISATESILEEVDSNGTRTVVAVSPDRGFDLVVVQHVVWTTRYELVRVRSRAGLTSREANQDLVCFAETLGQLDPETTFESARFVSEHEIEVRTETGEPWKTTFDPRTLLSARTVSHGCEE